MTAVLQRPIASVHGRDHIVTCSDGTVVRGADFDNAATTPALDAVVDRIRDVVPHHASVHRGAGRRSQWCTGEYESARSTVHRFVGADADDVVVFTRNTTDALNLLSRCVPGDTVVLDIEHHANLLPWRDRRVVRSAHTVEETLGRLQAELAAKPAALLAVTGASNVTGEVLPLERLADLAHRHGARILVDGAQLVPHRAVDVTEAGIDYLAFSGHKLYAPFGAGVLVGRRDWLDLAEPYLRGGGATAAVADVGGDLVIDWAPSPARHEGGTPNLLGAVAIAAACDEIESIGYDVIADHDRDCTDALVRGLAAVEGVSLVRVWSDANDVVGIASFTVDGVDASAVAAALSDDHGIAVRAGKFCAHPLLDRCGAPSGAIRASIGLGTTLADIDRLVDAVRVTYVSLRERALGWSLA